MPNASPLDFMAGQPSQATDLMQLLLTKYLASAGSSPSAIAQMYAKVHVEASDKVDAARRGVEDFANFCRGWLASQQPIQPSAGRDGPSLLLPGNVEVLLSPSLSSRSTGTVTPSIPMMGL